MNKNDVCGDADEDEPNYSSLLSDEGSVLIDLTISSSKTCELISTAEDLVMEISDESEKSDSSSSDVEVVEPSPITNTNIVGSPDDGQPIDCNMTDESDDIFLGFGTRENDEVLSVHSTERDINYQNHFENVNKCVHVDVDYESDDSFSLLVDEADVRASTLAAENLAITISDDDERNGSPSLDVSVVGPASITSILRSSNDGQPIDSVDTSDDKSLEIRADDEVPSARLNERNINNEVSQNSLSSTLRLQNIIKSFQDTMKVLVEDLINYIDEYSKDPKCSISHSYLGDFLNAIVNIQTNTMNLVNCFQVGLKAQGSEKPESSEVEIQKSDLNEFAEKDDSLDMSDFSIEDSENDEPELSNAEQSAITNFAASGSSSWNLCQADQGLVSSEKLPNLSENVPQEDQSNRNRLMVSLSKLKKLTVSDRETEMEEDQSDQNQSMASSFESYGLSFWDGEKQIENYNESDSSNISSSSKSHLFNVQKIFGLKRWSGFPYVADFFVNLTDSMKQGEEKSELNDSVNETEKDRPMLKEEHQMEKSHSQTSSNRDHSRVLNGNGELASVNSRLANYFLRPHPRKKKRPEENEGNRKELERKKRPRVLSQTSEKKSFDFYSVSGPTFKSANNPAKKTRR